jgi:hypothetical protein
MYRNLIQEPVFLIRIRDPVLFLIPGSGMEKNPQPGSGINIPDLIFENIVSFFWIKST